jgi:hypothetical protein
MKIGGFKLDDKKFMNIEQKDILTKQEQKFIIGGRWLNSIGVEPNKGRRDMYNDKTDEIIWAPE